MRRFPLLVALLAAAALAGCGGDDDEGGGGATGDGGTIEVVATDYAFDPADVSVEEAGETTFTVSNEGDFPHALEIEGSGIEEETETLDPGASGSVTVDLAPGEYVLYCPVGDHRERGMEGTLVVGGAAAGGRTSTDGNDSESDDSYGYG
jgi:plastocyanin